MTQQELTAKIVHGLNALRSVSSLPAQLHLEPGALVESALRIADLFADSETLEDARMLSQSNPQDTKAFLTAADRLQITDAHKLGEFSISSLAARNDIALAGLWLQGTVRGGGIDIAKFMQSLASRMD